MSRGPGRVQRAIIAAFAAEPERAFTVQELAHLAFPEESIAKRHKDAVDRSLRALRDELGLRVCRIGLPHGSGWRNIWGKRTKSMPVWVGSRQ